MLKIKFTWFPVVVNMGFMKEVSQRRLEGIWKRRDIINLNEELYTKSEVGEGKFSFVQAEFEMCLRKQLDMPF